MLPALRHMVHWPACLPRPDDRRKSIHHGLRMDLKRGLMFEIEAYNRLVNTENRRDSVLLTNGASRCSSGDLGR